MKKYLYIMSSEIKSTFAYRGDTWLTAIFSIFSVVLAYLLWSAVFGDSKTFNGFTLTQMTTYYLLSGILSPFTQSEGIFNEFSEEIKGGTYAKYVVRPISSLGYFLSASFARVLFPTIISIIVLSVAMISFNGYFHPILLINVVKALPVILLGAILNMLLGYLMAMATFKFTDIGFIYMFQNIFKSLLSGSLIPLNMILGHNLSMWSPFSYTLYYPVMLSMGKSDITPITAVSVLSLWVIIALIISLVLQRKAPKAFEGVGL